MEELSEHELSEHETDPNNQEAGATGILVQHFCFCPVPLGFTPITAIQYQDQLVELPITYNLQYLVGNWPKMIVDDRGVLQVDYPIRL